MRWIIFSLFFSAAIAAEIPSSQEGFVESGEAKLFYSVMGSGEPVVVLHGGPGLSYDYLLPQMGQLAKSRQLIFYDQRGAGRSEGGDDLEYLNVEVFVEDLEAIRRHFGLKKLKLIGHSWGGLLAMHYAIAHPELVEQLILLHPPPVSRDEYALFLEEFGRRAESFLKELTEMQTSKEFMDGDPETVSHFWRKLLSVYFAESNQVEELNLKTTKKAALGWIKVDRAFDATFFTCPFDLHEKLKSVTCKTLIVHGDKDPISVPMIERIHQSIPNSQLEILKDCGHFPYLERPNELFPILDAFLQENSCLPKNSL